MYVIGESRCVTLTPHKQTISEIETVRTSSHIGRRSQEPGTQAGRLGACPFFPGARVALSLSLRQQHGGDWSAGLAGVLDCLNAQGSWWEEAGEGLESQRE